MTDLHMNPLELNHTYESCLCKIEDSAAWKAIIDDKLLGPVRVPYTSADSPRKLMDP